MTVNDCFFQRPGVTVASALIDADHRDIVRSGHDDRKVLRVRGDSRDRLGGHNLEINCERLVFSQKIERLVRNLEEQGSRDVLANRSRKRIDRIGSADRIHREHVRFRVARIQSTGQERRCR